MRNKWKTILSTVVVFLFVFIGSGILFVKFAWFSMTMEEMLFHIKTSLTGASASVVNEYLLASILPSLLVTALYAILAGLGNKLARPLKWLAAAFCLVALIVGAYSFHLWTFLRGQFVSSTYIEDNYVDPKTVDLQFPEKKRNLIYIYLESMEMTYADKESGGAFDKNVIPELTLLAKENEDFSGNEYSLSRSDTPDNLLSRKEDLKSFQTLNSHIPDGSDYSEENDDEERGMLTVQNSNDKLNGGYAVEDTTWTMAAMFGQTSGLPLKIPMGQNQMVYVNKFMPGVTSLGDILEENGYHNVLMIGSNATFGGRRKYFQQHGDYEICDWPWAKKEGLIPSNYKVWWGYEDEKLFQYAEDKLTDLAAENQPFNFTMLTVDTHFEDGHSCRLCPSDNGDNKYANVMHCSSQQVVRFVHWIQDQDFYDNTTIIISGDHPTMDKDFCNDIDENYQRKVYTCIVNAPISPMDGERRREFTTLDMFPTTLAALNVKIPGDRLGMGTNLYSTEDTLAEKDGVDKINEEITYKSALMRTLYDGN